MVLIREIYFILITILILLPCSYGFDINVVVDEVIKGELIGVNYKEVIENEVFKVNFRFVNSGSSGYKGRGKLDIFNQTGDMIFTGWTEEVDFYPGTDRTFELYWYPEDMTGSFTGRLRMYYGNEIIENKSIRFEVKEMTIPERIMDILSVKVYDDEIETEIESRNSLTGLLIIPTKYPLGWIFEQDKIETIEENETRNVLISYEPSLWMDGRNLTMIIVTEDGKYFQDKTITLEKEKNLKGFLHNTNKWLGRVLLKIYNLKK